MHFLLFISLGPILFEKAKILYRRTKRGGKIKKSRLSRPRGLFGAMAVSFLFIRLSLRKKSL